jgi:hypothetical protein
MGFKLPVAELLGHREPVIAVDHEVFVLDLVELHRNRG